MSFISCIYSAHPAQCEQNNQKRILNQRKPSVCKLAEERKNSPWAWANKMRIHRRRRPPLLLLPPSSKQKKGKFAGVEMEGRGGRRGEGSGALQRSADCRNAHDKRRLMRRRRRSCSRGEGSRSWTRRSEVTSASGGGVQSSSSEAKHHSHLLLHEVQAAASPSSIKTLR